MNISHNPPGPPVKIEKSPKKTEKGPPPPPRHIHRQEEEKAGQEKAGEGSGNRNPEFCSGMRRVSLQLSHASEDEEGDAFDGELVFLGHIGMGELMKCHGDKEKQCRQNTADPVRNEGKVRCHLWKIAGR